MVNVKINGKLYPIDQLVDKTVYAKKDTLLYRWPGDKSSAKLQVKSGGLIGKVYSWVTRTEGIYLEFYSNSSQILKDYPSGSYYVLVSDIEDKALNQQGAKTSEQIAKEEREKKENEGKTTTDKILDTGTKIALGAVAIYVGGSILKSLIGGKNG